MVYSIPFSPILHSFCLTRTDLVYYNPNHRFSREAEGLSLLHKVASAVAALHSLGVAHLDIKPQNILLDPAYEPVLMDFGSCFVGSQVDSPPSTCSPPVSPVDLSNPPPHPLVVNITSKQQARDLEEDWSTSVSASYRPPECWDLSTYSCVDLAKIDVFQLACVLFNILYSFGFSPFESSTQGPLTLAARTATMSFPTTLGLSSSLQVFIKSNLDLDPGRRMEAQGFMAKCAVLQQATMDLSLSMVVWGLEEGEGARHSREGQDRGENQGEFAFQADFEGE